GGAYAPERTLPLAGYRDSKPVRVGNGASGQLQLDTFGNLLDTAFGYANRGFSIDRDTGKELADLADFVCGAWGEPYRGSWGGRGVAAFHPLQGHVLDRARSRDPSGRGRHLAGSEDRALEERSGAYSRVHRRALLVGIQANLRPVRGERGS